MLDPDLQRRQLPYLLRFPEARTSQTLQRLRGYGCTVRSGRRILAFRPLDDKPFLRPITEIYEGSPTEKAELKLGDIIISLNSKNVEGEAEALKKSQIYAKTGGVFPLSL